MSAPLSLRSFQEYDAAALTTLLHAAYAELGALGLNYTAVDQDVETTRTRALAGHCWLAEMNGALVGTLTISHPPSADLQTLSAAARTSGRVWLNQVAVSPSARGLGIAATLWRQGRAWAAAQGAHSIGVDTAIPAEHLVRLYRAWGFTQEETIHWPGKTYDSVVMIRPITPDDR